MKQIRTMTLCRVCLRPYPKANLCKPGWWWTTASFVVGVWGRSNPRLCRWGACWPMVICCAATPWPSWRMSAASMPWHCKTPWRATTHKPTLATTVNLPKAKPPTTACQAMRATRDATHAWPPFKMGRSMPCALWPVAWVRLRVCVVTNMRKRSMHKVNPSTVCTPEVTTSRA